MRNFIYKAVNSHGETIKGNLQAASEKQALMLLKQQNIFITEIAEQTTKVTVFKSIKKSVLSLLLRQLATLINSGLPLSESLQSIIKQQQHVKLTPIIKHIHNNILEGQSLTKSLSDCHPAFPSLCIASVEAGERSGNLGDALTECAEYYEHQQNVFATILQALIYPLMLSAVALMITVFLMINVVPKIITVFASSQHALPLPTVILLSLSHVLIHYGFALLFIFIVLGVGFAKALNNIKIKTYMHSVLLKTWGINSLIKTFYTTRFCLSLSMLLTSGVNVLEALMACSKLIPIIPMRYAVQQATERVKEGGSVYFSLDKTALFTPMTLQLIANGEQSGKLAEMLCKAATLENNRLQHFLKLALRLIEPLMILIMGGVVLFIVMAILLPIFQVDQLLS